MPGEAEACFFMGANCADPNGRPTARLDAACMPDAGVVDMEGFVLDQTRPLLKKLKPKALHTLHLGLSEEGSTLLGAQCLLFQHSWKAQNKGEVWPRFDGEVAFSLQGAVWVHLSYRRSNIWKSGWSFSFRSCL